MATKDNKSNSKIVKSGLLGACVLGNIILIGFLVSPGTIYKHLSISNKTFRMRGADDLGGGKIPVATSESNAADGTNGRLHVVLFASKRTGSSFTGELFNQNPDVMYLFEPLHWFTFSVLRGDMEGDTFDSRSIETLNSIFKCEFRDSPILRDLHKGFFCSSSRVLARTLPCGSRKGKSSGSLEDSIEKLTNICKSHMHQVVKTIRLYNLELLRPLAVEPTMKLKIIHLVRDPRGIMNSRRKLHQKNMDFVRKNVPWDETEDLCKDMSRNLQIVRSAPAWLKDRYMLVRYEDIAKAPGKMADRLYKFLGLHVPREVSRWMERNTKSFSPGSFSRSRNSSVTATKWKEELSFRELLKIQGKCAPAMEMLGYKLVNSTHDLKDEDNILGVLPADLSLPFV